MSLHNDPIQRTKPILRDGDSQRIRMPTNDFHLLNLPPPPVPILLPQSTSTHSLTTNRISPIPGNFNIPPPPSLSTTSTTTTTTTILNDTMSTFNKERLHDVLQQGLGTYVFIEHYGLVPKLNHF